MKRLLYTSILIAIALNLNADSLLPKSDPHRWEDDISAFGKAYKESGEPENGILFVGSSSIRLWNDLNEIFPELEIIQRGFGGSHISDIVHYFDRLILDCEPSQIVLYAGENDIASGRHPDGVVSDFKWLDQKIKEHLPNTTLIFISIKPSPNRTKFQEGYDLANDKIQEACEGNHQRIFVDVSSEMLTPEGNPKPELYVADGVHMTPIGYDLWKVKLIPHLKKPGINPTESN